MSVDKFFGSCPLSPVSAWLLQFGLVVNLFQACCSSRDAACTLEEVFFCSDAYIISGYVWWFGVYHSNGVLQRCSSPSRVSWHGEENLACLEGDRDERYPLCPQEITVRWGELETVRKVQSSEWARSQLPRYRLQVQFVWKKLQKCN